MDDIEREAIRAEGLDPDDPAVAEALELVRLELAANSESSYGQVASNSKGTGVPEGPQSVDASLVQAAMVPVIL